MFIKNNVPAFIIGESTPVLFNIVIAITIAQGARTDLINKPTEILPFFLKSGANTNPKPNEIKISGTIRLIIILLWMNCPLDRTPAINSNNPKDMEITMFFVIDSIIFCIKKPPLLYHNRPRGSNSMQYFWLN
ncbi:MAG: hypothetical protein PWQ37_73 [Candidatus Petromonas sp.]|jgi:hypothetical protein|nr:hypothetical protein [Candidatus Petromonas sp.]